MNEHNHIAKQTLNIAYLFQNISFNYSISSAAQLHIMYTLNSLSRRGHKASLFALQPEGRVLFSDAYDDIISDANQRDYYCQPNWTNSQAFKLVERVIRKSQTLLRLPYLSLIDDLRMYTSAVSNLSEVDLIHERYNGSEIGGVLASKKLGIPYILEVNADVIEQMKFQGKPLKGVQRISTLIKTRYCLHHAAKVICVSDQLEEHLNTNWNVDKNKTVALPCAADIDIFGKSFNAKEIRKRIGLDQEPLIVWVGGFFPWHNIEFLIECFSEVKEYVRNSKLLLVGDGKTKEAVEAKIHQCGLEDSVIITGLVDHRTIPEFLSIADVAVSPFTPIFPGHGGAPLKIFEYMAASKAIVATRISQLDNIIEDGKNGILVNPNDNQGFAKAIISLLNDQEKRSMLGMNARRKVSEEYSWEAYAGHLEGIYLDVLDGPN